MLKPGFYQWFKPKNKSVYFTLKMGLTQAWANILLLYANFCLEDTLKVKCILVCTCSVPSKAGTMYVQVCKLPCHHPPWENSVHFTDHAQTYFRNMKNTRRRNLVKLGYQRLATMKWQKWRKICLKCAHTCSGWTIHCWTKNIIKFWSF